MRRTDPDRVPLWAKFGLIPLCALLFLAVSVANTPRLANGAAYLVGAGGTDTFIAQGNAQNCDKTGCHGYTTGVLEHSGIAVHWPGTVPVGSSFPVRAPVWTFGEGQTVIANAGDAIWAITQTLLLYALTILPWGFVILRLAGWRRRRREAPSQP